MNLTVVLDNILLKSEKHSELLAHPGFGMNLLILITTKIMYVVGFLSIEGLSDLTSSLDPISCVVELTNILRLHSPIIITIILFLIWASMCILLNTDRIQSTLIFFLFATCESNFIHSSFIRVGTYSTLFWASSILFIVLFIKSNKPVHKHIFLFISGTFIGLSFLTKIQMFFLMTIPLLLLFFSDFSNGKKKNIYKLSHDRLAEISLTNFLFFITLSVLSFLVLIPGNLSSWMSSKEYGQATFVFNIFFILFFLSFFYTLLLVSDKKIKFILKFIFLFLLVLLIPMLNHRSIDPVFMGYFSTKSLIILCIYIFFLSLYWFSIFYYDQIKTFLISKTIFKKITENLTKLKKPENIEFSALLIVFTSGFLFSFLLHLLVFSDLKMSFNYMLYDFKVMFFRDTFYQVNLKILFDQLLNKTIYYYKELIINIIITVSILYCYKKAYIIISYKTLVSILAFFFITHFNMYFGTRVWAFYDSIFVDYPITIFGVIGLITIYNNCHIKVLKLRLFCLSIFSTLLFFNVQQLIVTEEIFKHHQHFYRWQYNRWSSGVYKGNHSLYTNLINSMYSEESSNLSCKIGILQKSRLQDAKFVFPNQKINQKYVGILSAGFPTLIDKPNYKITSYPNDLKNAIVVDNLKLEISRKGFFAPDSLLQPGYKDLSKENQLLAICPRLDLDIYFFTDKPSEGEKVLLEQGKILKIKKYYKESEDYINDFLNRKSKSEPLIIIENNIEKQIFHGYHINSFTELNINKLQGSGFFVIKQASRET